MDFSRISYQIPSLDSTPLPPMARIRQLFSREQVEDIENAVALELDKISHLNFKGKRLAVTCGSRLIRNIDRITLALVQGLKERGAEPFIVPSMGSHGNADAMGQVELLAGYGITEKSMGVPIISSMETEQIGTLEDGLPVHCDKAAFQSDGIVVVNRIKVHTDFKGAHESGLIKMMAIGLGNQKGALALHSRGFGRMAETLEETAGVFLREAPVCFGLAILENGYDETMALEAVLPGNFLEREKVLLERVRKNFGSLIMPRIDLLIIDEIGKDISGAGMDPNITGRPGSGLVEGFKAPPITRIAILGLSPRTHGNGSGMGMADFMTARAASLLDWGAVYTNCLTAGVPASARLPMVLKSDRHVISAALKTCPGVVPEEARIVRIKNTLEIEEIMVSPGVLQDLSGQNNFELLSSPEPMNFHTSGNLI